MIASQLLVRRECALHILFRERSFVQREIMSEKLELFGRE